MSTTTATRPGPVPDPERPAMTRTLDHVGIDLLDPDPAAGPCPVAAAPVDDEHGLVGEYRRLLEVIGALHEPAADRLSAVRAEVAARGTYRHTPEELVAGAKVAWRNHARCNGRMHWRSLRVRDRRDVASTAEVVLECLEHLRVSTNGGALRAVLTVFPQADADGRGFEVVNPQLVRYAGHRQPDGSVVGDPSTSVSRTSPSRWAGGPRAPSSRSSRSSSATPGAGRPCGRSRRTSSRRSTSPTRTTPASPSSACGGTSTPPSATRRSRSAGSTTASRRSAAGTSRPRSARATSAMPTATTSSQTSLGSWASTPDRTGPCGRTARSSS